MTRVIECDICIIGSGITAAMVAEKLADERNAKVVVVEAGDDTVPFSERIKKRQRFLDYDETPWGSDHIDGQSAEGIQSRSMQVGGLAMHWGGVTPRFSPEDFRVKSLYGVGNDWPVTYDELEPFYYEAETRIGVAGEQGPPALDPRSKPYPLPPIPLTYSLALLKEWGEKTGIKFWSQPSAKNSIPYKGRAQCCRNDTCDPVCPVGAKYSPDFTWDTLRKANRIQLVTRTLVRKLVLDPRSTRVSHAVATDRSRPGEPVEFHAKTFVVAAGYTWSSHLLLLSSEPRFADGLANRSGHVGRYLTGHRSVNGYVQLPIKLFPGMNGQHSVVSKTFMRPGPLDKYIRHDLRIWESSQGRAARLRNDAGDVMLGDEILADWRNRTATGTARVRGYYDVIPDRDSRLTLDAAAKNEWGDPMPKLAFKDAPESVNLRKYSEDKVRALFDTMARAGGGTVVSANASSFQDHPAGGCRMGNDPATSVVDSYGRAHDHENLFVVGAPTCVSGGCANGTLTFIALALRATTKIGEGVAARR